MACCRQYHVAGYGRVSKIYVKMWLNTQNIKIPVPILNVSIFGFCQIKFFFMSVRDFVVLIPTCDVDMSVIHCIQFMYMGMSSVNENIVLFILNVTLWKEPLSLKAMSTYIDVADTSTFALGNI